MVSVRMVGIRAVGGSSCGSSGLVGSGEAVSSGLADGVSFVLVFVVGGDVADAGVHPHIVTRFGRVRVRR